MSNNKSYISYSFWITLVVIVILLCATMIPRVDVGEYRIKRVNILSDIITFDWDTLDSNSAELDLDTTFMSNIYDTTGYVEVIDAKLGINGSGGDISTLKKRNISNRDSLAISIEMYDTIRTSSSVSEFYDKLLDSTNRDIRVAFFGDSFIEGDLFTADIRELLQDRFSGRGVGFVPITSIVSQFRGSVKHTFGGWTRHSLLTPKSIPKDLKDKFYVSGEIFEATDGAYVRYEGVKYRKYLKEVSLAQFIFMNRGESTINVIINDTISKTFTPQTSDEVQNIDITGDIHSVEIQIDNPEGFIGYGVVFEDGVGAVVDSYSLRGNSGLSLCGSSPLINRQINKSLEYDLIVLQYGLNVLTADVSDYRGYARLMRRVVAHMRMSFPKSAIIIMGVSDHSIKIDGEFVTMPTLKYMLDAQRSVAESCGVAFWSTFQAMGGENSMVDFVAKKWGAKDYTHFSQAGGKFLAKKFVASLFKGADDLYTNGYVRSISTPFFRGEPTVKKSIHTPITYKIELLPARYKMPPIDNVEIPI